MLKREKVKLQIKPSPGQPSVESVPVTQGVIVTVELLQLLHYLIQLSPSNTHVIRPYPTWLHGYPLLTDKIPDGLSAKCEVQQLPR